MTQAFRLGTRNSRLALYQTSLVQKALEAAHPGLPVETVVIKTSGDWWPEHGERHLSENGGGKAHFAREIEEALLGRAIDCGVHSLKDMAMRLPAGLAIDHVLPRGDPRDAWLANDGITIDTLPAGAAVGTSSPRRRAFLLARWPDLQVVPLRGNVPTRLDKLRGYKIDATLLAVAGLQRLGLEREITTVLEPEIMLPAAGQGIIGLETRVSDTRTRALLDAVHCTPTGLCAAAERAAVAVLAGTCHTPVGSYAMISGKRLHLDVALVAENGSSMRRERRDAAIQDVASAMVFGRMVGESVRGAG